MKPVTDNTQLSRFVLKGFKSIAECDLELGSLNILIGANGAGKSNFVEFFKLMQQLVESHLQLYVSRQGGPDALLYFGRKKTEQLEVHLYFGDKSYSCTLEPTQDNRMVFTNEGFVNIKTGAQTFVGGHFESLAAVNNETSLVFSCVPAMSQWRVFHFHDTSHSALIKQRNAIQDNIYLRPDARNLAAFLYILKQTHPAHYQKIVQTIRLTAPFFGDFFLRPQPDNPDMIELEWLEKGEDVPFKAHQLSDGTLRFACLATALLQPEEKQPATILFDEPELGLHPYAITLLASMLKSVSIKKQVIVSTQSVELISEFDPEDLVVVDRKDRASVFTRLESEKWQAWLQEYSLGELWTKNLFGGRPA